MIPGLLILLLVGVLALQRFWAAYQQRQLRYHYRYDCSLAEPGQTVTFTSTVANVGALPVLYVGLSEYFPDSVTPVNAESRMQKDLIRQFGEYRTDYTMYLLPHRQYHTRFQFSLPRRGVYSMGKYYLESGDFLGFRTAIHSGELRKKIVVMPSRSESSLVYQALGGYLGDVSVRRFLPEDPILTIGCRDYTGREPMKSIAWAQTARSGKMLVKQYDHTVEASATVLLNLDGGTREELEECLRITRTVCEELEKKRISYDYMTNGDTRGRVKNLFYLAQGLGKQHYLTIMYGLGTSACRNLRSFSQLVDRCTAQRRAGNGYILITPPLTAVQQNQLQHLRRHSDFDVCVLEAKAEGGDRA